MVLSAAAVDILAPMRPNPPRMVTVVLAVALTVIGLALVFLPPNEFADLLRQVELPRDMERTLLELAAERVVAYVLLLASPLLLIVGSLARGI
jgi:hypothetical protein